MLISLEFGLNMNEFLSNDLSNKKAILIGNYLFSFYNTYYYNGGTLQVLKG